MKAVLCTKYGPPEVLKLTEVPTPEPKENEVRIKIKATTVTAGDTRVRAFDVPRSVRLMVRLVLGFTKPRNGILGFELAGEIEAIGNKVSKWKVGDEIFAATLQSFGGYAQYKCLPEDGAMAIKPEGIPFQDAAAIPIGARTALYYLRRAKIQKGQKILVYGASGSVGTYAVQLAKYFGAEVTGVCGPANLELVQSLGAKRVIDYTRKGFVNKFEKYDIVLLAIDKLPFEVCEKILKDDGIYMNVAEPMKSFSMRWTAATTNKKIIVAENSPESSEDLIYLMDLVQLGAIKPVIDRSYHLDQIVEAHRYVDLGHKRGNVVVTV